MSGYIDECDEIATTKHLTLLKHKTRTQYIITVKPAIDKFILDCALEEEVNPGDYGLPSGLKDFTKVSKSVTSNSDQRFKGLFKELRNNREFRNLREALKYLIANSYNIDPKHLKIIFEMP